MHRSAKPISAVQFRPAPPFFFQFPVLCISARVAESADAPDLKSVGELNPCASSSLASGIFLSHLRKIPRYFSSPVFLWKLFKLLVLSVANPPPAFSGMENLLIKTATFCESFLTYAREYIVLSIFRSTLKGYEKNRKVLHYNKLRLLTSAWLHVRLW